MLLQVLIIFDRRELETAANIKDNLFGNYIEDVQEVCLSEVIYILVAQQQWARWWLK